MQKLLVSISGVAFDDGVKKGTKPTWFVYYEPVYKIGNLVVVKSLEKSYFMLTSDKFTCELLARSVLFEGLVVDGVVSELILEPTNKVGKNGVAYNEVVGFSKVGKADVFTPRPKKVVKVSKPVANVFAD